MQGEEPMDQKPCLKEDFGQDPKEDGRNQGSDVWTHPREWVPGLYRQIRACIGDVTNITFCKCLTSKVTISVYGLIMIVLVAVLGESQPSPARFLCPVSLSLILSTLALNRKLSALASGLLAVRYRLSMVLSWASCTEFRPHAKWCSCQVRNL